MHCEVQVVTTAMAGVRHKMHEVYKVVRADNRSQLLADVATPEVERGIVDWNNIKEHDLFFAAQSGRIATVKRLLEMGGGGAGDGGGVVDVNWQEENGRTAFYQAATLNYLPVLLVLLGHNADPNKEFTANGMTPISMAAQKGFFEIVRLLLEHGANPNKGRTSDGATPLYFAALTGHVDIATALLEHNADPNQARTADGATPLWIAALTGHVDIATALLEHNADPNQATTDEYGTTPLYTAAQKGHVDVATALLEHNADPNQATTNDGQTPLCMAAQQGHVDVATVLLGHNADPHTAMHRGEYAGQNPIGVAAECGHLAIIKVLLDAGGLTGTALTANGATDLWVACWQGHVEVVQYLLTRPTVDVNRARSDAKGGVNPTPGIPHPGTTPLEVAVLEGHTAISNLLKQHGAV